MKQRLKVCSMCPIPQVFQQSFLKRVRAFLENRRRLRFPPWTPVVAVVTEEEDRSVLLRVSASELFDLRLVQSCEDAWEVASRSRAPVILLDRDVPGASWRANVQALSSSSRHACVILLTNVVDEYLWQELIRYGGYDTLRSEER